MLYHQVDGLLKEYKALILEILKFWKIYVIYHKACHFEWLDHNLRYKGDAWSIVNTSIEQ